MVYLHSINKDIVRQSIPIYKELKFQSAFFFLPVPLQSASLRCLCPCVPDASLPSASRLPRPRLLPSQICAAGAAMAAEHAAVAVGEPPICFRNPVLAFPMLHSRPLPGFPVRASSPARSARPAPPWPPTMPWPRLASRRPPPRRSRRWRASRCQRRRQGKGPCPRLTRQSGGCGRLPSPAEDEPVLDRRGEPVPTAPP